MQPDALPPDILDALVRMRLLSEGMRPNAERLTGGVSSDIWRIDLPERPVCAKRALARLRVAVDWRAPVSRNRYEARWMVRANAAVPGAAPAVLGQDEASGTLVMEFLAPASHPLWKNELRDGRTDPEFAAHVARSLARIHAASAADPSVVAEFPTDPVFHAIRLEPYLIAAGRAHPDLAARLDELVATTQATRRALVHGDVSPKNILRGPAGPVFLDAECAWWGDPAFDLAFCLNHLLLKCVWTRSASAGFLACFDALVASYLALVDWELACELEARAAHLLPGLFLARVDGKSPVEYITEEGDKDRVRRCARRLLLSPTDRLGGVHAAWAEELGLAGGV
jgi:aminoglycoside phosphotransferase (APT) family kinase protein